MRVAVAVGVGGMDVHVGGAVGRVKGVLVGGTVEVGRLGFVVGVDTSTGKVGVQVGGKERGVEVLVGMAMICGISGGRRKAGKTDGTVKRITKPITTMMIPNMTKILKISHKDDFMVGILSRTQKILPK